MGKEVPGTCHVDEVDSTALGGTGQLRAARVETGFISDIPTYLLGPQT